MFGALGTFFGGKLGGALGSIAGGLFGNEFQSDEATFARDWSAGEAQKNRDWQEMMSNTAYQRQVKDMQAAGLNPMLAAMKGGGASTPSGSMGQTVSAGHSQKLTGGLDVTTAAQLENLEAQTDKERATAAEIRARTPTHEAFIERARQDIAESIERVKLIQQNVVTGGATAAHLNQQIANLREQLPQIRASTQQLQDLAYLNMAQAVETLTRSGLNEAQAKEIYQRIKQNLPEIQRAIMSLERLAMERADSGHAAQQGVEESLPGVLGRYLKAMNPLQGLVGAIPIGPRTIINRAPDVRINTGHGGPPPFTARDFPWNR